MANFIWTAILYISTGSIVLVCYRVFMQDRKVERERGTKAMIEKAYQITPGKRPATADAAIGGRPQAPAGARVQAPPPWAAKTRRA